MNMMDEAKINGARLALEELTDEWTRTNELALLLRAEMRRQAVTLHIDQGVSLATVCRITRTTRNTINDWVAAERVSRQEQKKLEKWDK